MIKEIIILGFPYDLDNTKILDEEDIELLYEKYNDDIINYVQGFFGLEIIFENYSKVITERFGLYPIFLNLKNFRIYNDIEIKDINYDFLKDSENYNDTRYLSPYRDEFLVSIEDNHFTADVVKKIAEIKELKYFPTIDNNFILLKNNSIYTIRDKDINREEKKFIDYKEDIDPSDRFEYIVKERTKNKKVLTQLSYGHDTRLIVAALLKNNIDFDYQSYGPEKELVERDLLPIIGKNPIEFDDDCIRENPINIVKEHLKSTSGFGDPFYKAHNYYYAENLYKNYDIIITGGEFNEFFDVWTNKIRLFYQSLRACTGYGNHHRYYINNGINLFFPYQDYKFLYSIRNLGNKNKISQDITEKIFPKMNTVKYWNDIWGSKPIVSKFGGYKFEFNTRKKYLELLIEDTKRKEENL